MQELRVSFTNMELINPYFLFHEKLIKQIPFEINVGILILSALQVIMQNMAQIITIADVKQTSKHKTSTQTIYNT